MIETCVKNHVLTPSSYLGHVFLLTRTEHYGRYQRDIGIRV